MKEKVELLKEFPVERQSLNIESILKDYETAPSFTNDAATTPTNYKSKKQKTNYLSEFKNQVKKLDIVPLNCIENCAGNYDKYLETTLSHIAKIKLNNIKFEYALKDPKIRKGIPSFPLSRIPCGASEPSKKILLLDLDETLVHADFNEEYVNNENIKYDTIIKFKSKNEEEEDLNENEFPFDLDIKKRNEELEKNKSETDNEEDEEISVGIFIRNGVQEFLTEVSKYFLVGIFTASVKEYADAVIDALDPEKKLINFRLYRSNCINVNDSFTVKDLRILKNFDLKNIILIDNSMYSFAAQLTNGVLINSFYTDKNDTELFNVLGYLLNFILQAYDVREVNEQFFNFQRITNDLIKEVKCIE